MGDPALRGRLLKICREHGLGVFTIRVWNTGGQVVNAIVAGVVPGIRLILLSDGLLRRFSPT